MGYLETLGQKLTYKNYNDKELIEKYKKNGLLQFLNVYLNHKDRFIKKEALHWGEEIEYTLYSIDPQSRKVQLANMGYSLIQGFNQQEDPEVYLQPEFGNFMVEAVPKTPYNSTEDLEDLLKCDLQIKKRRQILEKYFLLYEIGLLTLASPIILGTPNHISIEDPDLAEEVQRFEGRLQERNTYSQSQFTIDSTENPHPRFSGLMQSIRERRGEKVEILVPIYVDENTNLTEITADEPKPGFIYMDSMAFGMGCSCLQVTFESQTINHARYIHDQLLPWTPIFAALSANAPIFKGKLADIDMRWTVISQSVDCRTREERDPTSANFIPKSRYGTQNHYLSNHKYVKQEYMDTIQYKVSEEHMKILQKDNLLDDRLAYHIATLFARDPIPTFSNEHDESLFDNKEITAHFENLQSTNWNSMRFKPPPSVQSKIGWRVEFRSMDIQITDYENSVFIIVLCLVQNVINNYNVNFLMPISKIDENMRRAHLVNAYTEQKFWFRKNITNCDDYKKCKLEESDYLFSSEEEKSSETEDEFVELYIREIIEGNPDIGFKGIYPLIYEYLRDHYPKDQIEKVNEYLSFFLERAKGFHQTGASYIRNLVLNHPEYKQDSIVSQPIAHDIVADILEIGSNEGKRQQYYGNK